jgi:hypothetical protein
MACSELPRCRADIGIALHGSSNWVRSNTIDLPENEFGLLAAIGSALRELSLAQGKSTGPWH